MYDVKEISHWKELDFKSLQLYGISMSDAKAKNIVETLRKGHNHIYAFVGQYTWDKSLYNRLSNDDIDRLRKKKIILSVNGNFIPFIQRKILSARIKDSIALDYYFLPGDLGMRVAPDGFITSLKDNSQASQLGITIGCRVLNCNGQPFSVDILSNLLKANETYCLKIIPSFVLPSDVQKINNLILNPSSSNAKISAPSIQTSARKTVPQKRTIYIPPSSQSMFPRIKRRKKTVNFPTSTSLVSVPIEVGCRAKLIGVDNEGFKGFDNGIVQVLALNVQPGFHLVKIGGGVHLLVRENHLTRYDKEPQIFGEIDLPTTGTHIQIDGLINRVELNGLRGTVMDINVERMGWHVVRLNGGQVFKIQSRHLLVLESPIEARALSSIPTFPTPNTSQNTKVGLPAMTTPLFADYEERPSFEDASNTVGIQPKSPQFSKSFPRKQPMIQIFLSMIQYCSFFHNQV